MPPVDDTFSTRLAYALERLGISKSELERRAGLAPGSGSRYASGKRGKRPGAAVANRIADALKVSRDWLSSGEGEMMTAADAVVRDPHPNRLPVYSSVAFTSAPPKVQEWLQTRRLPKDLTPAEWARALDAAAVLYGFSLLYGPRPAAKAQGDQQKV